MKAEELLVDITARLYAKTIQDLRVVARMVGIRKPTGSRKDDLVFAVISYADGSFTPPPRSARGAPPKNRPYDAQLVADIIQCREYYFALRRGDVGKGEHTLTVSDGLAADGSCSGILEHGERRWYLHVNGGKLSGGTGVFVQESFVNRFNLREGDLVVGVAERLGEEQDYGLVSVLSVNGFEPDAVPERKSIRLLTPVYPFKAIRLERGLSGRMLDLFTPLGAGQRAVVAGDAHTGKTQLLNSIGAAICANYPQFTTVALALGARPEEVTELKESLAGGEVFSTGAEETVFSHLRAAQLILKYVQRRVELGADAVLLIDGLEHLLASDGKKEEAPEVVRLLSAAGCFKEGGSLTVVASVATADGASALLELAEKTANLCVYLSAEGAKRRLYPAIDLSRCFSAKPENLLTEEEISLAVRLKGKARGVEGLASVREKFLQTENNAQLLHDENS